MSEPWKLTPWFDPSIKPVREGVYAIKFDGGMGYSYWCGECWMSRALSMPDAHTFRRLRALGPIKAWRGLTAEAAE